MRCLGILLLLVGCVPRTPVDQCPEYCSRIRACMPDVQVDGEGPNACEENCRKAFSDAEVAQVYGFTDASVSCVVESATCSAAMECR